MSILVGGDSGGGSIVVKVFASHAEDLDSIPHQGKTIFGVPYSDIAGVLLKRRKLVSITHSLNYINNAHAIEHCFISTILEYLHAVVVSL